MSAQKKCYLDTGIILVIGYYLTEENRRYQMANSYLSQLNEDGILPVVSSWGLIESICRIWQENLEDRLEGNLTSKKLEALVSNKTQEYVEYLLKVLKSEGIKLIPAKTSIELHGVYKAIKNGFHGTITKTINQDGIRRKKSNYAGAPDLIHLQFARSSNCDVFVTFDRGFENISEHKSIYSGNIKVIRS